MRESLKKYVIAEDKTILEALAQLNRLTFDLNLFVLDQDLTLMGSVTDGDIRRSILTGVKLQDPITAAMNPSCKYLLAGQIDLNVIIEQRNKDIKILPIVNSEKQIVDLLNYSETRTLLPIDAVVMAGGMGTRLLPLTQNTPKPLLPIGDKPIIEYNLQRMQKFGIRNIHITVNYLKEQIQEYVANLPSNSNHIGCFVETKPLGTIGALSLMGDWHNDYVLLTNSDLLTTIDYEDFFLEFIESGADMMVAVMPYTIKVPYALLELEKDRVKAFKEKPEYIYHANTGIYLLKKEVISLIPQDRLYNATDLMEKLIQENRKVSYYQMVSYWLDIGKHEDYKKALEDIKHLKF